MRIKEFNPSGIEIHNELLGRVEKKKVEEYPNLDYYLKFKPAVELVKKTQPWPVPSDPEKRFLNDIHAMLSEKLGLDDLTKLEIYTANGSHLDVWHGVDFLVELKTDKGRRIMVTADITKNRNKGDESRADILEYVPEDGIDPKANYKEYLEIIEELSQRFSELIKSKINGNYN